MQGLTNVSMMYLNYPAKVLFKSSRMVPIMCFGVVWQVRLRSTVLAPLADLCPEADILVCNRKSS